MSGAQDLQLFEQLVDNANSLFLSDEDFVVINGVTKPTLKKIYADFMASIGTFITVADGLEATNGTGTNNRFFTVPEAGNTYETRYRNDAGAAVQVGRISSAETIEKVLELIRAADGTPIYALLDDIGFAWGAINTDGFDLPGLSVKPTRESSTTLLDPEGFLILEDGEEGMTLGPLSVRHVPGDGLWVLDDLGFVWNNLLDSASQVVPVDPVIPSTIPILYGPICGVHGEYTSLYVRNVLTERPAKNTVLGTITSITLPEIQTSDFELKFLTESMGASAYLYLRSELSDAERSRLLMSCVSAPNPGAGGGNVLTIGDSIQNRQGAHLQKQYAESWGYFPDFIGTLEGSTQAEDTENSDGPLGESREGWETGDFTYSITDRVSIVEPGGEAAYLALPKSSKWKINPFLRVATGSDSADIIRNGMVFDPAFYQSRFSLGTPAVVNITLGTNNVRDRSVAEIYDNAYSDLTLLISQCRAAWPLAKIVLSCPGTPRDPARDVLWETKYVPYLRALIQAKKDAGSTNVIVFPAWAHMTQEAGYTIASATAKVDPLTGTSTGALGDTVHPRGSVRLELHKAYAKMLACIFANLI
ncbi:hypothetical protein ACIQYF_14130 [Pseudomonas sp. NPDC096917]|uniref:hypothetical protein n=1 Tax=Pseudomonas sp. NPDC096917 TaxID=3364483 RepID=UPI00383ACA6D